LWLFAAGLVGGACSNGSPAQTGRVDAAAPSGSTGTGGTNVGTGGAGGTTGVSGGGGTAMASSGAAGTNGAAGTSGAAGAGGAPPPTAAAPCPQPSPDAVWTIVPIQSARGPIDVVSTWAASSNDAWLVGTGLRFPTPTMFVRDDQIQHWDGKRWTTSFDGFPTHILSSVYGFGGADVWTVGDVAVHWNGATWTDLSPASAGQPLGLKPVWGVASNDVWAGNRGSFFHWNGTAWTAVLTTPPLASSDMNMGGIWGATSNDVWALGDFPASHAFLGILRWDGSVWSILAQRYTSEQAELNGVWGNAANDIWAVGFSFSGSQIWHYDGTSWAHVPVPSFVGELSGVWGFCASDVWAVGEELPPGGFGVDDEVGIVLHFDGQTWSRFALGTTVKPLLTVSGVSSEDLWVGGTNGTMLHRHH
jgi:hypothetical protein